MRRAMAEAEVGDDVLDGDPTVQRLEGRVAELLGKERALFFPSGTMANQSAICLLSRPGTEILVDANAHIVHWEMAGAATFAGVQIRPVTSAGGMMDAAGVRTSLRPTSRFAPSISLLCLENTHNGAGGRVIPLAALRELAALAHENGLPVHLDGARLWNAAIATGTPLTDYAACATTVMVSFSKGLGAPVGAALAGSTEAMDKAWRIRKRFGGAMRQAGIIAAAALHALEHHLHRLAEDHRLAAELADMLDGISGVTAVRPDTNIVMLDLPREFASRVVVNAARRGVLVSEWSATRIRAVTHMDADRGQVRHAGAILAEAITECPSSSDRSDDPRFPNAPTLPYI
ncbi:MAG: GntG family PLP-dependent aldolase [Gemmatimonadaceae bacterium]